MNVFADIENIFWDIPMRTRIRQHDPTADVSEHPEEPWVYKADLSDHEIKIYFDGNTWSYTLRPTTGAGGKESEKVNVPGSENHVKLAAINCLRRYCTTCNEEVTFSYQVLTWKGRTDGPGEVTDITCKTCDDLSHLLDYRDTKVLTTKVMVMSALALQREEFRKESAAREEESRCDPFPHPQFLPLLEEVKAASDRLQKLVGEFEQTAWFGGLQKQSKTSKTSRWACKYGRNEMMAMAMAARWRATLHGPEEAYHIDLLCAEDSPTPTMGINSIRATEEQAGDLIRGAIAAFNKGNLNLDRNDKVGILGIW